MGDDGWFERTFLLTDLVGSSTLWDRQPDAMAAAVARHDELVADVVAASGGTLVKSKGEGDATFSVFERAADAAAAAVTLQRRMASEPWPGGLGLSMRIGVHTGGAESRAGDWFGPGVNRAARLRSIAGAAQIIVSSSAAALLADHPPPGIRLVHVGRQVLRGLDRPEEVWELFPADGPSVVVGPPAPSPAPRGARDDLVGRDDDVAAVRDALGERRLVTLVGPGGTGKTRLALEVATSVAQAFRDGVTTVELASVAEASLVDLHVAAEAGVPSGDLGEGGVARFRLLDHWRDAELLVVLDNCEHVIDAAAALAAAVVAECPGVTILATSREALAVRGEHVVAVAPLALPPEDADTVDDVAGIASVELLVARASAARPGFVLDAASLPAVVRLCRLVEGMPLAIELAAGRLRNLALDDLVASLTGRVHELAGGRRDADARHRTLRATIDWSHDLLPADAQVVARRLSVFLGGFALDAVAAVTDVPDATAVVEDLVARSIVLVVDPVVGRYRLLEPVRQYLAAKLAEAGEAADVHARHARWVAALARRLAPGVLTEGDVVRRLRAERSNANAALEWALSNDDHDLALEIVGWLGVYWYTNDLVVGITWCRRVLAEATTDDPRTHARALLAYGTVLQGQGVEEVAEAVPPLRGALARYRELDHRPGLSSTLFFLGRALGILGVVDEHRRAVPEAVACLEEGRVLAREIGNEVSAAWCLSWLGLLSDDPTAAEEAARQIIAEAGPLGVEHPVANARRQLAFLLAQRGEIEEARREIDACVSTYRRLEDRWQLVIALADHAMVAYVAGDVEQARTSALDALAVAIDVGSHAALPSVLLRFALAQAGSGNADSARQLIRVVDWVHVTFGEWDLLLEPLLRDALGGEPVVPDAPEPLGPTALRRLARQLLAAERDAG